MATEHYKVTQGYVNPTGEFKKGQVLTPSELGDTPEHLLFAGLVEKTDAPADSHAATTPATDKPKKASKPKAPKQPKQEAVAPQDAPEQPIEDKQP
jgi:hypothetical protein